MNNVQGVGNFTLSTMHPLILGGTAISMKGYKLEDTFLDATPLMENSKIIALIDGTLTITNKVKAGTLKINCVRVDADYKKGDWVAWGNELLKLGDSIGSTIRGAYEFNGAQFGISFFTCCIKTLKPAILAGNDAPSYDIELTYADWDFV
jgi:hypothetical protein